MKGFTFFSQKEKISKPLFNLASERPSFPCNDQKETSTAKTWSFMGSRPGGHNSICPTSTSELQVRLCSLLNIQKRSTQCQSVRTQSPWSLGLKQICFLLCKDYGKPGPFLILSIKMIVKDALIWTLPCVGVALPEKRRYWHQRPLAWRVLQGSLQEWWLPAHGLICAMATISLGLQLPGLSAAGCYTLYPVFSPLSSQVCNVTFWDECVSSDIKGPFKSILENFPETNHLILSLCSIFNWSRCFKTISCFRMVSTKCHLSSGVSLS